jgi:hypothetical protein
VNIRSAIAWTVLVVVPIVKCLGVSESVPDCPPQSGLPDAVVLRCLDSFPSTLTSITAPTSIPVDAMSELELCRIRHLRQFTGPQRGLDKSVDVVLMTAAKRFANHPDPPQRGRVAAKG